MPEGLAVQYTSPLPDGEQAEAFDWPLHHLHPAFITRNVTDFGICNEENGAVLMKDWVLFKEGFGAGITILLMLTG